MRFCVFVTFYAFPFGPSCFMFDFDGIDTMSALLLLWLSWIELERCTYGSDSSVFSFSSYTYSILSIRRMSFSVFYFLTGIKITPSVLEFSYGHSMFFADNFGEGALCSILFKWDSSQPIISLEERQR